MSSDDFRFAQFAERTRGKEFFEVIYLAEQEALRAWRSAHPSKEMTDRERTRSIEYQQRLIGLIAYLRHGIVGQDCSERVHALYRTIRESLRHDARMAG